jgi:hypothetical protein
MVICAKLGEDNSGHPWVAQKEVDRRSTEERLQLLVKRMAYSHEQLDCLVVMMSIPRIG